MAITTGMILDIVVILLLIPTIIYAVILNRRLTALRRSREELSKVVSSFNEATMRAEAGIPKLKKATTEANHTLKDRVEKAQTLRDDLAFMIERAEEMAGRLEGAVRTARNEGVVTHGPAAASANSYTAGPAPVTRPLAENAAPARGFSIGNPGMSPAAPSTLTAATLAQTAAGFEETAAELRSALGAARAEARVSEARAGGPVPHFGLSHGGGARPKRVIGGERPLADRAMTAEIVSDEERSEAERELLKALQSAR
jgi:hypothetical protein